MPNNFPQHSHGDHSPIAVPDHFKRGDREGWHITRTTLPVLPEGADWHQGVDTWVLHMPGVALGWEYFNLYLVDLRGPGVDGKPATLTYPDATHEIGLFAMDNEDGPVDPYDPRTWRPLMPINYVAQFHGVPAGKLASMAYALVELLVSGVLPVEPQGFVAAAHREDTGEIRADITGEQVPVWVGSGMNRMSAREYFKTLVANYAEEERRLAARAN